MGVTKTKQHIGKSYEDETHLAKLWHVIGQCSRSLKTRQLKIVNKSRSLIPDGSMCEITGSHEIGMEDNTQISKTLKVLAKQCHL